MGSLLLFFFGGGCKITFTNVNIGKIFLADIGIKMSNGSKSCLSRKHTESSVCGLDNVALSGTDL